MRKSWKRFPGRSPKPSVGETQEGRKHSLGENPFHLTLLLSMALAVLVAIGLFAPTEPNLGKRLADHSQRKVILFPQNESSDLPRLHGLEREKLLFNGFPEAKPHCEPIPKGAHQSSFQPHLSGFVDKVWVFDGNQVNEGKWLGLKDANGMEVKNGYVSSSNAYLAEVWAPGWCNGKMQFVRVSCKPFCRSDADCNDGNIWTWDACHLPGQCRSFCLHATPFNATVTPKEVAANKGAWEYGDYVKRLVG